MEEFPHLLVVDCRQVVFEASNELRGLEGNFEEQEELASYIPLQLVFYQSVEYRDLVLGDSTRQHALDAVYPVRVVETHHVRTEDQAPSHRNCVLVVVY